MNWTDYSHYTKQYIKKRFVSLRFLVEWGPVYLIHDLSFTYHKIHLALMILGPLSLTSLGLEGIRSSSFTFDSHISHNFPSNLLKWGYF